MMVGLTGKRRKQYLMMMLTMMLMMMCERLKARAQTLLAVVLS